MKKFSAVSDWLRAREEIRAEIGFVPTMGALHEGHLSLVRKCVQENGYAIASIFVNPTQFDRADDLAAYPESLEEDLEYLEKAGVDAVLLPSCEEIYPDRFDYSVREERLSKKYCGAHRPGHFDGVLTVVLKLFQIIRPDRAYFGEKDFQQLELVRGMTRAFFLGVDIVACPIQREQDGLALSSRNRRLDEHQRALAPSLYREISSSQDAVTARLRLETLGFEVDYVEDFAGRRLAAASLGNIRLIDNVPLPES